jgi:hypothetical protein
MLLLSEFKNSNAYDFFHDNKEAFERRIFDKHLWLKQQNNYVGGREVDNSGYREFLKI